MKKKSVLKYIAPMLVLFLAITAWFGVKQAVGAVQRLEKIDAYYTGMPVEVGKEISLKDISVTAQYYIQNGQSGYNEYIDIKKDFTISPSVIQNKGENKIVVTYQQKSCVITVVGKVVESINASYMGDTLYVGAAIPVGKVQVYASFSDGSYEQVKDFTLSTTTISKEGANSIPVVYQGKTAFITVYGKAPLAVEDISAYYAGGSIIAGNDINKSDIVVTLYYNDGTTKNVTNFNISPSVVETEGMNEITVSYGDVSTTINVYGEERYITKMEAEYTGGGVIVGKKVSRDEIEVIVTYNDGSEEEIDTYDMYGDLILFEGENIVLIYCDAFMGEINVTGVKGFAANYDNAISCYIASPDYKYYTEVTLGMNMDVEAGKFTLQAADNDMVEYVVQRVIPTEEFLGFELIYDDDEMVLEFPMAMKVTVPEEFDPEKFGVYYTPNKSTIMAKVNGDFVDEEQTEYEFIVYEPGTYILIHEVSNRLVTEIIVETEIKLKENRSYSLNPVVFPLSAENREVEYWSTDENVATVSENGKIRTHSEGTCEIWVEATDDSGVYAVITVVVKNGKGK